LVLTTRQRSRNGGRSSRRPASRRSELQAKRNSLADKLTVEAQALTHRKIERTAVESERRIVEADLGPVKYLATLLGVAEEVVLRWFNLIVALLLDPTVVLLLLAATRRRPYAPRRKAACREAVERADNTPMW
jgi:hypothetical protein